MARKATLKLRRKTRKAATRATKTAKLGSGIRFKAVEAAAKASGASDPGAVAADAGRKKYGKKTMKRLAAAGRRKKRKKK